MVAATHPEERETSIDGLLGHAHAHDTPRIAADELARLIDSGDPPVLLDVRSRSGYLRDPYRIPGARRVRPDEIPDWARQNEADKLVVLYCT